jgi:hypothetical protein
VIKLRRTRWAAWVTHNGDLKCIHNFFRKHEGKRPLRRPRHRWEDNIRMDLGEMGRKVWFIWLRIGTSSGLL